MNWVFELASGTRSGSGRHQAFRMTSSRRAVAMDVGIRWGTPWGGTTQSIPLDAVIRDFMGIGISSCVWDCPVRC